MRITLLTLTAAVGAGALLFFAAGCASGTGRTGFDGGSSPSDSSTSSDAARVDVPRPDGCSGGQHVCGSECVDDLAQNPAAGCRLGCGEACPAPANAVASCTTGGTCDFECPAPFVREGMGCTCTPSTCEALTFTCGMQDDGCGGMVVCGECGEGGTCTDGSCACMADDAETNENQAGAFALTAQSDAPNSTETYAAFALGSETDTDWFAVAVSDDFDGGNPQITVTLSDIPAGSDYSLGGWYDCSGNSTACDAGTFDTEVGRGCVSDMPGTAIERISLDTECTGTSDDGTLFIRVVANTWADACAPYNLRVAVN